MAVRCVQAWYIFNIIKGIICELTASMASAIRLVFFLFIHISSLYDTRKNSNLCNKNDGDDDDDGNDGNV